MFSLQIVDTDAFLDMPLSTQALYFHLTMRADDEGFIANPRKILRLVNCQTDDLKILITKRFILTFKSGVVVVKHWLIHNTIRMDRFNKTAYQEEKSYLAIKDNNSYTESHKIDNLTIKKIAPRKKAPWQIKRDKAYKESSLPDSFAYKMRDAFYGKKCPICGVMMEKKEFNDNKVPTIQHNKPISKGGKHEIDNISICCKQCNLSVQNNETDDLNNSEIKEVWHALGNHMETQVKLSKVKLSKVRERFQPPTKKQVGNYCTERNNEINPEKFVDYYQSKGWLVGKSKMIDWQAAVRNWEKSESKNELSEIQNKINSSSTESDVDVKNKSEFKLSEAIAYWNIFSGKEALAKLKLIDCVNKSVINYGLFPIVNTQTKLFSEYWAEISIDKKQWQETVQKYAKEILNRKKDTSGYQMHRFSMYEFLTKEKGYLKFQNL